MYTKLELVKLLREETSTSGQGVATTINQTGEMLRLVNWINIAHASIQTEVYDWSFLFRQGSQTVLTQFIPTPTDLNVWVYDRFKLDGVPIELIKYKDYYPETSAPTSKPNVIVLMPDGSLIFDTVPDVPYTLTYDYYAKPKILDADNDTTLIPDQFIYAIIGKAMMKLGTYEAAPEILQAGADYYREFMDKMRKACTNVEQSEYLKSDAYIQVVSE